MAGTRKPYASIFSRSSLGVLGRRLPVDSADGANGLPSTIRVPATKRETSGSKSRMRGGAGGTGGVAGAAGGRTTLPLVGLLVRVIANPRTLLFGVLVFVSTPALYFFGRGQAHRQENGRRLTEPLNFGVEFAVPETQQQQQRDSGGEQTPLKNAVDDALLEGERRRISRPTPPSSKPKPRALLPVEVFRDVPPEECLPSPLWTKQVDPSEYEFGCEEIEVREERSMQLWVVVVVNHTVCWCYQLVSYVCTSAALFLCM